MAEKKKTESHKEAYYQTKILTWLKKTYPEAFVWKANQGPYSNLNGLPDICAVIAGHFFGFECKRPGGKATKLQETAISRINSAGGTALVVTTVAEVQEAIEKALQCDPLSGQG